MRRIYVGDKQFYPILILWLVQNANANQKTIEKLKEYQEINTLKNHIEYSEQSDDVLSEYDTKTFHISHIDEEKGNSFLFWTRTFSHIMMKSFLLVMINQLHYLPR